MAQFAMFGLILGSAWGLGPDDPSGRLRDVGTALFLVGAALGVAGALPLGTRLSPFPAPVDGAALRTSGVFGLVRHPIYGGVILLFLGIALRSGSWVAMVLAAGLVPFFWAKSDHEEILLEWRFPEYVEYRDRVRHRFIPFVL